MSIVFVRLFLLLLVLVLTLHFVFAQFNTSMRFNECLVSDFCHWNYAQSCCFLLSIWIEIAHIFLLIFSNWVYYFINFFSYVRSHLVLKFSITWWQKLIENKKNTQKNFIHCSLLDFDIPHILLHYNVFSSVLINFKRPSTRKKVSN